MDKAVLLYGMFLLYRTMAPAELFSDQAFFLSCFRSPFVSSVLPLNNPLRIVRNIVLLVTFSVMTAMVQYLTQKKRKFNVFSFILTMTLLWFVKEYDNNFYDVALIAAALLVGIGGMIWQLWDMEENDEEEA